jgi:enamine deaminase RidA (YjgF/YER057c/UK114 family)
MNETGLHKPGVLAPVKPVIVREILPGAEVTRILFAMHEELHLSLRPIPGEPPLAMVSRLAGLLSAYNATVVRHEVFGSLEAYAPVIQAMQREVADFDWPVCWVEGKPAAKPAISGMHIFAVAGIHVETICQAGRPVARTFSDGSFKHCLLGGLTSANRAAAKPDQCRETLEQLLDPLSAAGMDMTNVVRTWFFLDDILDWYGDFNRVRNEFFQREKVFDGLVPASTGIGGRNPAGGAIIAGAWAVQPGNELATVREVVSPLQCPATQYGSSFSRAVLLEGADARRLLVSGTASIEPGGQSVWVGDLEKQIEMSVEVAQAILAANDFDFGEVTRATGYFKDPHNGRSLQSGGEPVRQSVTVQADICRPELLFEIELDAICVL